MTDITNGMHLNHRPLSKKQPPSKPAAIETPIARHALRDFGKTGFREVTLTVFTKHEPSVSYEILHIWKVDDGPSCSSVYFLTEPAALRGSAVKVVERPYLEDMEIWLRLPTAKQPCRVGSSRRDQMVLGTDFSYSDLRFWFPTNSLEIHDFDFQTTPDGEVCVLRARRIPSSTEACDLHLILDGTRWLPLTVEWLNPRGTPDRVYEASGLVCVDGVWMPRTISISCPREQYKSVMTLRRALSGVPMEANLFRTENLSQLSEAVFEKWIRQSNEFP